MSGEDTQHLTEYEQGPNPVCGNCKVGEHGLCTEFDCGCHYKPDDGHGTRLGSDEWRNGSYLPIEATPGDVAARAEGVRLRPALEHHHGPDCVECITLARSTVMAFAVEAGLATGPVDVDDVVRSVVARAFGSAKENVASPVHVDRFDCWCGPVKDYEDPATGNQVWLHREVSS